METPAFLQTPIGIAVLMVLSSIGGGWIKDRVSTETRDTASAVRIDAIDRRMTDYVSGAVSRAQFEEASTATNKRLDDVREDLRDIKVEIERIERTRAIDPAARR